MATVAPTTTRSFFESAFEKVSAFAREHRVRRARRIALVTLMDMDTHRLNDLGIEIRVAHYPPYASKYNPIEHRLFPHLTRTCKGVILHSVDRVAELMRKATTRTGLEVDVTILDKVYKLGRKLSQAMKASINLVRDAVLPRWNYRILPNV
jgi:uncharacterized protein YjiS (DUF1127 family)